MRPQLSIVVAVHGGADRLPAVLDALGAQLREDVEVLVCVRAGEKGAHDLGPIERFATLIEGGAEALIPHLWRDGILAAKAPRVAITVSHCRPDPGWIEALLAADLDTYAAIGGAIDNDPDSNPRGWAIYLLRYLRFGRPLEPRETADLAGDNALYDRAAVLTHKDAFADGFWEPRIHALLVAEGRRLRLDPSLRVIHSNGYTTREFAAQRLAHGRRFGRDRGLGLSPVWRFLYPTVIPAVPLVFGARILSQVLQRSLARRPLLFAVPHLTLFLAAWAAGELWGSLDAVMGR